MAGLDTRTGRRNAEPPPRRAESIKQVKTQQTRVPSRSAVQAAKQSVSQSSGQPSQSSGATSNVTGNPSNQLNFNDQQALMMSRARTAAQQDYDRDLGTAQSFGGIARAREVNNQASSSEAEAAKQYAANVQAVTTARNLASTGQTSQRQAENAAANQSFAANAIQANAVIEQASEESRRQSTVNAAQQRKTETEGMFSLLGSLNNSFSQGSYKYW